MIISCQDNSGEGFWDVDMWMDIWNSNKFDMKSFRNAAFL